MASPRKVTDEALLSAYTQTKSVWKVAEIVGICGQSVHERLAKLGVLERTKWTKEEDLMLVQMYEKYSETLFLRGLSNELKRSEAAISCRAHELGITDPPRKRSVEHSDNIVKSKIANGTVNSFKNCSNPHSRSIIGKRADLNNTFFRSSAEANYARYLNFIGHEWDFEPKEFYFERIKKGCVTYTPDFFNKTTDQWIEIKGWFDTKSITKLKRFKKYYPAEFAKLTMVTQSKKSAEIACSLGIPFVRYEDIKKRHSHLIKGWEHSRRC
jgi:hypothetical protein